MASFFCDLAPQLGCWLAARQMHIVMLRAVMRAPLTFFDTTPIGRIISRFAKDVDVLDTSLPPQISDTIYCLFEVISFVACRKYRFGRISYIIAFPVSSQPRSLSSTRVSSLYTGELCIHLRLRLDTVVIPGIYNLCLLKGV